MMSVGSGYNQDGETHMYIIIRYTGYSITLALHTQSLHALCTIAILDMLSWRSLPNEFLCACAIVMCVFVFSENVDNTKASEDISGCGLCLCLLESLTLATQTWNANWPVYHSVGMWSLKNECLEQRPNKDFYWSTMETSLDIRHSKLGLPSIHSHMSFKLEGWVYYTR